MMRDVPSLLILGDVPVESSHHGSALLYRLFEGYPADRLLILEPSIAQSQTGRRLPDVSYRRLAAGHRRIVDSRFHRAYCGLLAVLARSRARRVDAALGGFSPDAVVSVAHGFHWLAAAAYAESEGLPLHLICHDDLPRLGAVPAVMSGWFEAEFSRVYRGAASRHCVSPWMRAEYVARYGVEGTVLYPSRAAGVARFAGLGEKTMSHSGALTVAFAGSVNSRGYVHSLALMAEALSLSGGRLLIYGPLRAEEARSAGLVAPNIELMGMLSSGVLIQRLRSEADVLFVPMSFEPADAANMRLGFPSKLTDYTAAGLPLLIFGPADCSAVRWARSEPGVGEVVDRNELVSLAHSLERLRDVQRRRALAERALEVGSRLFDHSEVASRFFASVCAHGVG